MNEATPMAFAQIEQHIAARGYAPASSRVGVTVWRTPGGKRAKYELTLSQVGNVYWLNEYSLHPRRTHVQKWMVNF